MVPRVVAACVRQPPCVGAPPSSALRLAQPPCSSTSSHRLPPQSSPSSACSEGSEKTTRGGGGEWESIKIPRENLTYVLESTRRASLPTRSRPRSYWKATSPQNWVRNTEITAEDKTRCMERYERNSVDQNQTNCLTHISSNTSCA
jgi:hypothetical protein